MFTTVERWRAILFANAYHIITGQTHSVVLFPDDHYTVYGVVQGQAVGPLGTIYVTRSLRG